MHPIQSFADLQPGQLLPTLTRDIDRQQLIKFAGAVDDYAAPHWDHLYMRQLGFPGVIVHGWLTFAVMCQTVNAWVALEIADLTDFSVRYLKPNMPGPANYGGRVASVTAADKRGATLEIWVDSPQDVRLATGNATLFFI